MHTKLSENGYLWFAVFDSNKKIDKVFLHENECLKYVKDFNKIMDGIR